MHKTEGFLTNSSINDVYSVNMYILLSEFPINER